MKNVLIIAPDYMGYMVKVADELKKHQDLRVIDIHIPEFKYSHFLLKIKNFFLKKLGRDLKFDFRKKFIEKIITDQTFDIILIIRPDLLSIKTLKALKSKTKCFKTYFYDGIHRYSKKLERIHLFDEIFSFEPNDCKEFGFQFITNFIYDSENKTPLNAQPIIYSLFNISSYDKRRFPTLKNIAELLRKQKIDYKFIVKTNKKINSTGLIEIIKKPIQLEAIKLLINQSFCMLDLGQIYKHQGLTFRVFEAIGLHKKIITNNPDIANYDFYNPENILVIDENNIVIPNDFFLTKYQKIPQYIFQKYTIKTWIKTVFKEVIDKHETPFNIEKPNR